MINTTTCEKIIIKRRQLYNKYILFMFGLLSLAIQKNIRKKSYDNQHLITYV